MSSKHDKLDDIFIKRNLFMERLESIKPGSYPTDRLDLSSKHTQQRLRESALKGVEEMFEALAHLKNWKPHRFTDVPDFNREEFLEEVVDAFNYFFALLIQVGVTSDEFYDAFLKKDDIIHHRLDDKY